MAKPKNTELERLRAEALAKHKAATRKISRLKTSKGAVISGTQYDPRKSPALLKRYTTPQLKAYLRRLEYFNSRKVQFVGDMRKRPVEQGTWTEYQRAEKKYHDRVRTEFERIKDLKMPVGDQTIGDRMEQITPTQRGAYNPPVNAPYNPTQRKPRMITSESSMRKLTEDMLRKASPENRAKEIARDRETFTKMAELINEPGLAQAVNGLTANQFHLLWNYTGFANDWGLSYATMKNRLTERDVGTGHEEMQIALREAHGLIEWAKKFDLG